MKLQLFKSTGKWTNQYKVNIFTFLKTEYVDTGNFSWCHNVLLSPVLAYFSFLSLPPVASLFCLSHAVSCHCCHSLLRHQMPSDFPTFLYLPCNDLFSSSPSHLTFPAHLLTCACLPASTCTCLPTCKTWRINKPLKIILPSVCTPNQSSFTCVWNRNAGRC